MKAAKLYYIHYVRLSEVLEEKLLQDCDGLPAKGETVQVCIRADPLQGTLAEPGGLGNPAENSFKTPI